MTFITETPLNQADPASKSNRPAMRFLPYRGRITHLVYSSAVSHNNGPQ
jgi:hypothetical protein